MLSQGAVPLRNEVWEASVRAQGKLFVGLGIFLLLAVFAMLRAADASPMSGARVNGRAIIKAE